MACDLVHSVAVARRRLANHVPTKVRLTPFPNETGEGFPKRTGKPFVSVTGGGTDPVEDLTLELADEPVPAMNWRHPSVVSPKADREAPESPVGPPH